MAKDRINRDELADKLVERAAGAEDPLRTMAELITGFLMEAEVASQVGAEAHERTEQRTTHRNGYRDRRWDTRLGTLQLQVPKVREGGYVPSFIEHRKRSEQALISVIQEAVVKGVSTRKIEAVLEELGIAGVSAGQVSQLCAALDEKVRKFREGPLGEIRYVWVDALYEKVRVDDRVESMAIVIATGANLQGRREVLGFDVIAAESEEGWAEFFKGLKERGLHGVKLVISDAPSSACLREHCEADDSQPAQSQRRARLWHRVHQAQRPALAPYSRPLLDSVPRWEMVRFASARRREERSVPSQSLRLCESRPLRGSRPER